MNHNQTKKIFENWNSFIIEAQMPTQLESVLDLNNTAWMESQEKFLKHLLNLKKIAKLYPEESQRIYRMLSKVGYFVKDLSKFSSYKKEGWDVDGPASMSEIFSVVMEDVLDTLRGNFRDDMFIDKQKREPSIRAMTTRDSMRQSQMNYQRAFRKFQGLTPRRSRPENNPLSKAIGEPVLFILGLSNMEEFDTIDWAVYGASWLLPIGRLGGLVKSLIPKAIVTKATAGASRLLLRQTPLRNKIRKDLVAYLASRKILEAAARGSYRKFIKDFFSLLAEVYVWVQFLKFTERLIRKNLYDKDDPKYKMLSERLKQLQMDIQIGTDALDAGLNLVDVMLKSAEDENPKALQDVIDNTGISMKRQFEDIIEKSKNQNYGNEKKEFEDEINEFP